ncbi:MAG: GNAT family N-acetyltransferase [Myxococcota bacterium]|nr:GNAT family N-acetyltransferase [Myxococcota bacterium]
MDGVVRAAEPHDLDRVAALWTAITHHHAPLDPLFTQRADAGEVLGELIRELHRDRDAAIFVFDAAGDLPGMCIVRIDHAPPILQETERAEITDIGVRADARRRGIARRLVEAALAWVRAAGVERVEIQVAVHNPEGQAFWRALGFGDLLHVLHRRL